MTAIEDAFLAVRLALETAAVRYAVGGSWASIAFGEPRLTNDVDIVVDFTPDGLERFLAALPGTFSLDFQAARSAYRAGRAFNVFYLPAIYKFDFFPARAFPLGLQEIDRAVLQGNSPLSAVPIPVVSPEDILLAKLHWYKSAGEVSSIQWRDIYGVVAGNRGKLDLDYLRANAPTLDVADLLERALAE